jgi:hypothetical protein
LAVAVISSFALGKEGLESSLEDFIDLIFLNYYSSFN